MGFFDWLFGKKEAVGRDELLDNSVCPQCWGYENYDDQFREASKDHKKDLANKVSRNAFIQNFIETRITGIIMKSEGDKLVCPKCKSGYKHVRTKAN